MNVTRSRRMNLALFIWSGLALAWILINYVRLFSVRCGSIEDELFGAVENGVFSEEAVCFNIAAHGGRAMLALDFAIRTGIIWAVGIGILAAIWFIVRDRGPAQSASVAVAPTAAPSTTPEGWYADAERPGHTRWWNGSAWGIRDDEHSLTSQTELAPVQASPARSCESCGAARNPTGRFCTACGHA